MGFELKIIYHPRGPEGSYDLSETKELKRKVGKMYEPCSDEALAVEALKQFSRRDVLVTDIEAYEYVKKPLKVIPGKNGNVTIRNRKYNLDGKDLGEIQDVGADTCESYEIEEDIPNSPKPSAPPQPKPQPVAPPPPKVKKVLRREVFEPDDRTMMARGKEFARKGLQPGNSYEILAEEKRSDTLTVYTVRTSKGVEIQLDAAQFVAEGDGLVGGFDIEESSDVNLGGSYVNDPGMPKLR